MKELKFPLYGLIRNCYGLHEENCVYTEEQMRQYDSNVIEQLQIIENLNADCKWTDAIPRWGNDTALVKLLHNEEELRLFLQGYDNTNIDTYYPDNEDNVKDENGEFGDWRDDYYWENTIHNYYDDGYDNPTMQHILENFKF